MATSSYKTFLMQKKENAYEKLVDIKDFPDLGGEPELLEHIDLKWILPEEVDLSDFCPADRHLLPLLRSL